MLGRRPAGAPGPVPSHPPPSHQGLAPATPVAPGRLIRRAGGKTAFNAVAERDEQIRWHSDQSHDQESSIAEIAQILAVTTANNEATASHRNLRISQVSVAGLRRLALPDCQKQAASCWRTKAWQ